MSPGRPSKYAPRVLEDFSHHPHALVILSSEYLGNYG